jgi:tartrate dehydratase beta subunit/fumarate hydratase class I family protein
MNIHLEPEGKAKHHGILQVDFTNRLIYYVGPVPPTKSEVVGPSGPTTATRMDKFTRQMLERSGQIGVTGKANRGPEGIAVMDKSRPYLSYSLTRRLPAIRVTDPEERLLARRSCRCRM